MVTFKNVNNLARVYVIAGLLKVFRKFGIILTVLAQIIMIALKATGKIDSYVVTLLPIIIVCSIVLLFYAWVGHKMLHGAKNV